MYVYGYKTNDNNNSILSAIMQNYLFVIRNQEPYNGNPHAKLILHSHVVQRHVRVCAMMTSPAVQNAIIHNC